MRKRITLLITALMLALMMSFGSVAAFAANAPAGCEKVRGHHSLRGVRKEREPTEVPADDVQEGQRQLFARGGGGLRHALSCGPVQGLV